MSYHDKMIKYIKSEESPHKMTVVVSSRVIKESSSSDRTLFDRCVYILSTSGPSSLQKAATEYKNARKALTERTPMNDLGVMSFIEEIKL